MEVSHVAECPDLGPECFGPVAPIPYNHHVSQVIAETSLDVSLGITPWFGLDARWALRVTDVNPTYSELDGTPKEVPDDIHHHDETLVDPTDPWLLARFAGVAGDFVSVGRIGLSFPVGRTEEDPYELGRVGKSHEHLQSGTGTFVPIVGLGLAYTIAPGSSAPVTLGLGGVGFFNLYENHHAFRAPMRVYASHRVAVTFLDGTLTPAAEVSIGHEGEEYWHGMAGLEGSNVRTEVYLGGSLRWAFYESWAVEATARGRVASLTDAPTFTSQGVFSLALSTSFSLWGDGDGEAAEEAEDEDGDEIKEKHRPGVIEFEKD
jgi:hypothetical protein